MARPAKVLPPLLAEEVQEAPKPQVQKRFYKGTQELDSDLFKLELGIMIKNQSWNEKPDWVKVEHVHFYRTYDSAGKKLTTSNSVGGHHHIVTVVDSKDGVPTVEVSPAMKYVRKKVRGVEQIVAAPIEHDDHTHEITYLKSQKVLIRQANMEFAKLQSQEAQKANSVEGIIPGA